MFAEVPPELDRIGKIIVDAAFTVHKTLGPGLLESVYRICLAHELEKRGLHVEREVPVGIEYDNIKFPAAFRIDLLVEGAIIIETKSVETFEQVHAAQLLTYLKLTNGQLGYLINFNVPLLKDGLKRFARSI
jgi:GxxExxY protein